MMLNWSWLEAGLAAVVFPLLYITSPILLCIVLTWVADQVISELWVDRLFVTESKE